MSKQLSFRVSSALKNIIGRDLINDKYIAVFELVKNSYDAGASKINLEIQNLKNGNTTIIIADDGCGMSYDDILNKWLFVAYSEKNVKNRSSNNNYRDKMKRHVAGAKGVGRFSCDRLGSKLTLYTKSEDHLYASKLVIDWDSFEVDDTNEFINIHVEYAQINKMPNGFSKGTILEISNLREKWDRTSIVTLKKSLMKLINPNTENIEDPFDIILSVPDEESNDKKAAKRDKVNGVIENDVFEKLNIKTTNLSVSIDSEGNTITTTLADRDENVFKIVEANTSYKLLKDIDISVFYLNSSAKANFTRTMGLQPVKYGSIFIYKNGFRIYPYGNPGEDFFGIDRRKQQGYNRFLGTREIMGRISIKNDNRDFTETTSRDGGFIQNHNVDMLKDFFGQKVLKVLERYVVNIIKWGEPVKAENDRVVMPHEVMDKIMSEFAYISKKSEILSVEYNSLLLTSLSEKNNNSIAGAALRLEKAAAYSDNPAILTLAKQLRKKTDALLTENTYLETDILAKSEEIAVIKTEKEIREKQVYFYKGMANQSVENLVTGMHSIFTLTEAVRSNTSYLQRLYNSDSLSDKTEVYEILAEIFKANQKINKLSELAIKGNKSLKQIGKNSIYDFIAQYLEEGLATKRLKYRIIAEENNPYNCSFDTASIGIIIDNIFSNSLKANANEVSIHLSENDRFVKIAFLDDGDGLDSSINTDILFDLGTTTTENKKGFGIGLHHIKILVDEMNGSISISKDNKNGFELVVNLLK